MKISNSRRNIHEKWENLCKTELSYRQHRQKRSRAIDNIHKTESSYRQYTQKRSRTIDNIHKNGVELSTTYTKTKSSYRQHT